LFCIHLFQKADALMMPLVWRCVSSLDKNAFIASIAGNHNGEAPCLP
jgi:hypothetical protein